MRKRSLFLDVFFISYTQFHVCKRFLLVCARFFDDKSCYISILVRKNLAQLLL